MDNLDANGEKEEKLRESIHSQSIWLFDSLHKQKKKRKKKLKKVDAPVHGLRLHVSKPNPQIWSEILSRQLQHGNVATAIQLHTDNISITLKLSTLDKQGWRVEQVKTCAVCTCKLSTTGTGVTGEWTGPMPS